MIQMNENDIRSAGSASATAQTAENRERQDERVGLTIKKKKKGTLQP